MSDCGRKIPVKEIMEDKKSVLQPRRSRSVSVGPSRAAKNDSKSFFNKRDNPLFSVSGTSPPESSSEAKKPSPGSSRSQDVSCVSRGRTIARNSVVDSSGISSGARRGIGRSLSRIDSRRGQQPTSKPSSFRNYESEVEQEHEITSLVESLRSKVQSESDPINQKKPNVTSSESEILSKESFEFEAWSGLFPFCDPGDGSSIASCQPEPALNYEEIDHPLSDAGLEGIYETIRSEVRRAVSELQGNLGNAIQTKGPNATGITEIPHELENLDSVEYLSDIRTEYSTKLEQSQEHARKLRADLYQEEQRCQELSRILKEIVPNPKPSDAQKARPEQKASVERRNISRRLTEETLNYFDECVLISTFDSADLSSLEDPLLVPGVDFTVAHSSSDWHNHVKDSESQYSFSLAGSDFTKEDVGLRDNEVGLEISSEANGISHYIKKFQREAMRDGEQMEVGTKYKLAHHYDSKLSAEKLLYEKVVNRNRMDSGGLLLCDLNRYL